MQISVAWQRRRSDDGEGSNNREAKILRIHKVTMHPSYDPSVSRITDDLALIRLTPEVRWNEFVRPACLPEATDDDSFSDSMATVAGWGLTQTGIKKMLITLSIIIY